MRVFLLNSKTHKGARYLLITDFATILAISLPSVAQAVVFEIFPPFSRQDDKEVCVIV